MPVLDKWLLFDNPSINWQPHAGQLVVAESNARHKVVSAGRRFGKSKLGATDKLVPEIFYTRPLATTLLAEGRRRIFWLVGPAYSDSEKEFRVIWDLCKKLEIPMDKGSTYSPETGDMRIRLFGGAMEILAKSAQHPERLVGEGLSGVIMCEAAKMKETIWPKYIRPTLADFGGWAFFSSTPEGKNWFYNLWRAARDPANANWQSWRMPAWRNHFVYTETGRAIASGRLPANTPIPPEEFTTDEAVTKTLELQRQSSDSIYKLTKERNIRIDVEILDSINELTPEAFLQEIAADFTEFVGRVFKEFDEETHVTDLVYNPAWQSVAAVDWGFNNPSVWLLIQLGPWGEINVLDEVYESGLDPEDFAWEIRERGLRPSNLSYFYPDPADPLASRILEKKLNIHARGGTGGELNSRLNHIRKALRDPRTVTANDLSLEGGIKRPQLMFDRRCKSTIADMQNYRYPEKRSDAETSTKRFDLPMKRDDHGPEALGRMFAGIFGTFGKPATGAKIHSSKLSHTDNDILEDDDKSTLAYRRPALHEKRRTEFPRHSDAMSDYFGG